MEVGIVLGFNSEDDTCRREVCRVHDVGGRAEVGAYTDTFVKQLVSQSVLLPAYHLLR